MEIEVDVPIAGGSGSVSVAVTKPSAAQPQHGYVFVHGVNSDRDEYLGLYRTLADDLSSDGFISARFDLAGHGDRTEDPYNLTLNRMSRETAGCLRYLSSTYGLERQQLCLMGTSFGAAAAITAAALYPQLVSHLVLLAPASDFDQLYLNPIDPERRKRYAGLLEKAMTKGESFPLEKSVCFTPGLVFEFATVDIRKLFAELDCRITVLHGDDDGLIPIDLSRQLVANNPRAEFIELPGTEHGFTEVGDENGDREGTLANIETIRRVLRK